MFWFSSSEKIFLPVLIAHKNISFINQNIILMLMFAFNLSYNFQYGYLGFLCSDYISFMEGWKNLKCWIHPSVLKIIYVM